MRMSGWLAAGGLLAAMATMGPAQVPADKAVADKTNTDRPAADRAAPIPVEMFAALPPIEGAQLSPDGQHFAAKMAIGGKQYFVISGYTGKEKPVTLPIGDKQDVNWWRWVGDQWLVVGVGATQILYGEEYYITRVLSLSSDGKTAKQIGWRDAGLRADDLIWRARDGTPRILLGKQTGIQEQADFYPSVFEYDLATGKGRRVVPGIANVYDWYADATGAVRMGWQYDDNSRRGALLYRTAATGDFQRVAVQRRGQTDGIVVPLVFRKDGSAVAIDDADGRDAVYEMSLPC